MFATTSMLIHYLIKFGRTSMLIHYRKHTYFWRSHAAEINLFSAAYFLTGENNNKILFSAASIENNSNLFKAQNECSYSIIKEQIMSYILEITK
jgi:hypothetical protein